MMSCTITPKDAFNSPAALHYCAQLRVVRMRLRRAFLPCLLVLQGIVFEAALGDCPVEENLGVDSRVVLAGKGCPST